MLKNISRLEEMVEGKAIHLTCDMDCNTNQIKQALFSFLKFIGNIEDQAKVQAEAQKSLQAEVSTEELITQPTHEG